MPVPIVITQGFTGEHHGIDLASVGRVIGVNILAPIDLLIEQVGSVKTGYGNYVFARDLKTGQQLRFGHLANPANLKPGQRVARGSLIGFMGSTGNSSGPHLHFETRSNTGAYIPPPKEWLPALFSAVGRVRDNIVSNATGSPVNRTTTTTRPAVTYPTRTLSYTMATPQARAKQTFIPSLNAAMLGRASSGVSQAITPESIINAAGFGGSKLGEALARTAITEGKKEVAALKKSIDWSGVAFVSVGVVLTLIAFIYFITLMTGSAVGAVAGSETGRDVVKSAVMLAV
jgi:hypothetical protein